MQAEGERAGRTCRDERPNVQGWLGSERRLDARNICICACACACACTLPAEPSHASAPAPARPGVLSRLLFGWVWPLLRRGAAAQLEHDTLEPLWWASLLHAATHPLIIPPMSSPRPKRPAVAPKCAAQVRGRPAPRGPVGPRLGGGEAVAAALRAPLRAALLGAGHSPSPRLRSAP